MLYCVAYIAKYFTEYNGAIGILRRIGKYNIQLYIKEMLSWANCYMYVSNFEKAKEYFENLSLI